MSQTATLENIHEIVAETKKTVHQFKKDNDELLEKKANSEAVAELEVKVDKHLEEITKVMEAQQKFEAEQTAKTKALEYASNGKAPNEKEGQSTPEMTKAFNDFLRKGATSRGEDFVDYCRIKNLEIPKTIVLKDLSVNIDPSGGFFVTPEIGQRMVTRFFETSPIRQVADVRTITSDALEFVADNDESESGGWVGEKSSRATTGTPDIDLIRIDANEQFAQPRATQKILDDAGFDIEGWLADKNADILGRTENTAFVIGDGSNKPKGFTTYDAWAAPGVYETNAIEQINSLSDGAFTADGILDLQNSLIEVYQGQSTWIVKRASFKEIAKLKDQENNYLFNRALDKNVGRPFDLLGSPVMFADDMPVIGSNSLSLAYGDFRRGYMIVDRLGMRILRDPFTEKPFTLFYTTKRVGGQVVNFEAIKLQKLAA